MGHGIGGIRLKLSRVLLRSNMDLTMVPELYLHRIQRPHSLDVLCIEVGWTRNPMNEWAGMLSLCPDPWKTSATDDRSASGRCPRLSGQYRMHIYFLKR